SVPAEVESEGVVSLAAGNGCMTVTPVRGGGNDCARNAKSVSSLVSLLIGGRRFRTASVSAVDSEVAGAGVVAGRVSGCSGPSLNRKRRPSSSSDVSCFDVYVLFAETLKLGCGATATTK